MLDTEPAVVDREENPTLGPYEGREHAVTRQTEDGGERSPAIVNEDDEFFRATKSTDEEDESVPVTVTAIPELAPCTCENSPIR